MGFFGSLAADSYDRQYTDRQLARRIIQYFAKHRRLGITIITMAFSLALVAALRPVLIAAAIDALETDENSLSLILAGLLAIAVTEYFSNWLRRRSLTRVVARIVAKMRKEAFDAAIARDMAFYDTQKTGKVTSRITSDTQEFGDVMIFTAEVVNQFMSVIILLVVLLGRSGELSLLLILTMPFVTLAALGFRRLARRVTRQGARAMAVVNDNIQETVSGISVAKNFRREGTIYDEFTEINQMSYGINMRRGIILAAIFPVLNSLAGIATALILYIGAQAVVFGQISAGNWFLFLQGVDRFYFPFINLAAFWSQFQQGLSAAERVFALIDAENTVVQTDDQAITQMAGNIAFQNVTFGYDADTPILTNFDLNIQPAESIAIVGHTGAGKSTITKLITRFYEFQDGTIQIDGNDIRSFDLQSYRARLGIVPQQPFLFSGTVLDNARYGCPSATDEAITTIAYSIGNGEWLEAMPHGLQTDVGERGARLSMGQRQLVSLLRVLVQKPDIFILDEATASIDPFTEVQIQEAIEMILAQATSILIAHRLSTVQSADRIIVLENGAIIEEGNHQALLQHGGHYAELYDTYFRHQSLSYIEGARDRFADAGS